MRMPMLLQYGDSIICGIFSKNIYIYIYLKKNDFIYIQ